MPRKIYEISKSFLLVFHQRISTCRKEIYRRKFYWKHPAGRKKKQQNCSQPHPDYLDKDSQRLAKISIVVLECWIDFVTYQWGPRCDWLLTQSLLILRKEWTLDFDITFILIWKIWKRECDEIRFLCNSYFHYAKHVFSPLDKWYCTEAIIAINTVSFPVSNKRSSE